MSNTPLNSTVSFIDQDETYWVNMVSLIDENISRYFMLFVWLIGNIGSILNCIIFCQAALRKSPCAMYFIASNASQFIINNFALLTRIFLYGFNIKTIYIELWFCKFRNYFFYVLLAASRYYTILASVDRYFASSRDALHRQWSSPKIAIRFIIGNILFWCFIYIHVIIFYQTYPNNCLPQQGIYGIFFSIYILIDNGILPLVFMSVFGYLTFKNVRQIKQRVRPLATSTTTNQSNQMNIASRKDSQFIKLLFNQIALYIIFNIFYPCCLFYQTITMNIQKSLIRLQVETLFSNMSYYLIYIGFSLTFFTNISSSSLFRNEFKRFIQIKVFRRRAIQLTAKLPSNRIAR
jgi:hypothetical protein